MICLLFASFFLCSSRRHLTKATRTRRLSRTYGDSHPSSRCALTFCQFPDGRESEVSPTVCCVFRFRFLRPAKSRRIHHGSVQPVALFLSRFVDRFLLSNALSALFSSGRSICRTPLEVQLTNLFPFPYTPPPHLAASDSSPSVDCGRITPSPRSLDFPPLSLKRIFELLLSHAPLFLMAFLFTVGGPGIPQLFLLRRARSA